MSPLKPWIENLFFRASKFSCAFSSLGNFWDQATVCEPFTGAIGDKKLFPCKEMGRPICLNAYIHCVSEFNPVGPRCVLMSQLNPWPGLVRVLELGAGFRNLLHLAAAGSWPLGQGTWHVKSEKCIKMLNCHDKSSSASETSNCFCWHIVWTLQFSMDPWWSFWTVKMSHA